MVLETSEHRRIAERDSGLARWGLWGSYLPDRQWGTVREDYSADGNAWAYFPHDHARSRVYRWGEDGLLGICDEQCRLCFAIALCCTEFWMYVLRVSSALVCPSKPKLSSGIFFISSSPLMLNIS